MRSFLDSWQPDPVYAVGSWGQDDDYDYIFIVENIFLDHDQALGLAKDMNQLDRSPRKSWTVFMVEPGSDFIGWEELDVPS